jgi:hypothetical protein
MATTEAERKTDLKCEHGIELRVFGDPKYQYLRVRNPGKCGCNCFYIKDHHEWDENGNYVRSLR